MSGGRKYIATNDGVEVDAATLDSWFRDDYDDEHKASEILEFLPGPYKSAFNDWLEDQVKRGFLEAADAD